jgi:hypothetical protein
MTTKPAQLKKWRNRVNKWKQISTISPKEIFYICQNYLAESTDALLGRQRREYPPSMRIPPEKVSQFFPLIWAAEIRGMSTEASQIERAIMPMMTLVGSGELDKKSNFYKIITEGECAVKSLCRKIQLEICGTKKSENGEMLTMTSLPESKKIWESIKNNFGMSKKTFGKKMNFVSSDFKREIIFRDVEHAYLLASSDFSKPAVILAGGVIEELLRLYLEHKNIKPASDEFNTYILTCEQNRLLKKGTSSLSNSVRHFRNLVHLAEEETKKHTISKSTAIGAVASIFTIANDF